MINGDILLLINNVVLTAMFLPTVLKKDSRIDVKTGIVYVPMIAMGAIGYFINGQIGPAIPTALGSVLWAVMTVKSWRAEQASR